MLCCSTIAAWRPVPALSIDISCLNERHSAANLQHADAVGE